MTKSQLIELSKLLLSDNIDDQVIGLTILNENCSELDPNLIRAIALACSNSSYMGGLSVQESSNIMDKWNESIDADPNWSVVYGGINNIKEYIKMKINEIE